MKKQHYVYSFLSMFLVLSMFISCSDDKEATPMMSVSSQSVTLAASGEEKLVEITTNQPEWKATRPELDNWCTLKMEGNLLKISAPKNETITSRSTRVTVVSGNTQPQEITVIQLPSDPFLNIVGDTPVNIDAAGTAITLTIQTNTGIWNATHPEADTWCTLSKEGDQLTISATAYTVNAERKTTISLTYGTDATIAPKTFEVKQQGSAPVYSISIPTDFSTGSVQKAMYQNIKVAEICQEYIRTGSTNKQMVVIYPVTDGKADLTKGLSVADAGSIVWDITANTCTYTPGSATELTKLYLSDGVFSTSTTNASPVVTKVEADLLTDGRPSDRSIYKIVKIGTQYWMAENLRAQNYLDGTAIPKITNGTEWNNNTTGTFKLPYNDNETFLTNGGYYSGNAMYNPAGLAPEGWIVPSNIEWGKLQTYIGTSYGTKLKSSSGWNNTSSGGNGNGTNITGFNAAPSGYYTSGTGDTGDGSEVYYWSTTKAKDLITRKESPYYYRFTTGTGMPSDLHDFNFGHVIRCVRK